MYIISLKYIIFNFSGAESLAFLALALTGFNPKTKRVIAKTLNKKATVVNTTKLTSKKESKSISIANNNISSY